MAATHTFSHDAPAIVPDHRDLAAWLRAAAKSHERATMAAAENWAYDLAIRSAEKLRSAADIVEHAM